MDHKYKTRLYVADPLEAGTMITLEDAAAHYLLSTLRLKEGERVALFNGVDGEWLARATGIRKKALDVEVERQLRPHISAPDIWLVFAPVKNEKIDYTVKRAVELGVSALLPVMTRRTIVSRVNMERLSANAVEAAEQSGRTDVPVLQEPVPLEALLGRWDATRTLLFCDEGGEGVPVRTLLPSLTPGKYAVLIGPEGGFTPEERQLLLKLPFARALSLGPRVLRAETAALAALANVQAWLGDWDKPPVFDAT